MPPSPGQIHSLPIKVLYNIDTSSQSYVTVLQDRQEVYVHPPSSSSSTAAEGPMGSCYLKPTIRGICYASPECIPNSSKLDFSVYNLDPSLRPRASPAFSATHVAQDGSWTGKGFLSWALAEANNGSTLIRGRLIQDDDFSGPSDVGLGGLEGLMAAASRASRTDGERGWGLEVQITLKVLNPDGKEAFRGRREFDQLLRGGNVVNSSITPSNSVAPPVRPEPFRRPMPAPNPGPSGPLRAGGSAPMALPPSHHASSNPPTSLRPSPIIPKSQLPTSSGPPSSRLSLPPSLPPSQHPSSIPMASSSSNGAYQSRTPPTHPGSDRPNPPSHSSTLGLPSSSRPASRSREVTPPPIARPKSPPPSTPSRKKLHDLLRSDGRMSPGLAAQLASNPMLLRLLKAVPANGNALSSLSTSLGDVESDKPSPDVETPTPSSVATMRVTQSSDGCSNCGITESEMWRTKKFKDGAMKKVCNACGLYFNEHKRMRPPELWDHLPSDTPRKRKLDPEQPIRSSPRRHRTNGSISAPPLPAAFESPKKRGRGPNKTPQPSPRMATRLSSKLDTSAGTTAAGLSFAKAMEGHTGLNATIGNGDNLFFPSMFDSPVDPLTGNSNPSGAGSVPTDTTLQTMDGGQTNEGDVDIEALLAQITNNDGGEFDLQAIFGEGAGDGLLDMLNTWEGDGKAGDSGHVQGGQQGTQGHA